MTIANGTIKRKKDCVFLEVGSEWIGVIPETVGQFTGGHDKNGNKIFEGDVDKYGLVIGWNQLHFCWGTFNRGGGFVKELLCNPYYQEWTDSGIEIIGNIHEQKNEKN